MRLKHCPTMCGTYPRCACGTEDDKVRDHCIAEPGVVPVPLVHEEIVGYHVYRDGKRDTELENMANATLQDPPESSIANTFSNTLYRDGACAPGWPKVPPDPTVVYVGEAPVGAKLMAFGDKVFMVATGMAPHWVTPTGLVLMQRADGSE